MNANRFFSVPYNCQHDSKVDKLWRLEGGVIAFGRWIALLGLLYDEDGVIDLDGRGQREQMLDRLDFRGGKAKANAALDAFLETCSELGLISLSELKARNIVTSEGVVTELQRRATNSSNGRQKGKKKSEAKSETESEAKSETESES